MSAVPRPDVSQSRITVRGPAESCQYAQVVQLPAAVHERLRRRVERATSGPGSQASGSHHGRGSRRDLGEHRPAARDQLRAPAADRPERRLGERGPWRELQVPVHGRHDVDDLASGPAAQNAACSAAMWASSCALICGRDRLVGRRGSAPPATSRISTAVRQPARPRCAPRATAIVGIEQRAGQPRRARPGTTAADAAPRARPAARTVQSRGGIQVLQDEVVADGGARARRGCAALARCPSNGSTTRRSPAGPRRRLAAAICAGPANPS